MTFDAIWCPAEVAAPSRARKSAMKVNEVTSTKNASPMGTPSFRWLQRVGKSGQDQRLKMRNGA